MGRLALRPALRAYAHAPAAAPVAGWTNTKSMAFDGSTDYFGSAVGGGLPNGLAGSQAYSVSFWFRGTFTGSGTQGIPVCSCFAAGSTIRYRLNVYSNQAWITEAGDSYNQENTGQSIVSDTWYHFVTTSLGTGASNSCKTYLNGNATPIHEQNGAAFASTSYVQSLQVGAIASTGYSEFMDGIVDEVGVWRGTVLTPTEVGLVFNGGGSGLPGDLEDTTGLTVPDSYYRLGDLDDTDGASGVIEDRTGSYNLFAVGAPSASTTVKT